MSVLPQAGVLDKLGGGDDTFLGRMVEIAIVTPDHRKTMEGLTRLGIGPWRVYTFDPTTVTDQTYQGKACEFTLKVCFAQHGDMVWELMEPVSGPTIFADYLRDHGEGIHHVAYDCNDVPLEDRIAEMKRRGFRPVQSGKWMRENAFVFFDTDDATTTCFETYAFPEGWDYPEPEEWYPAPPASEGPT